MRTLRSALMVVTGVVAVCLGACGQKESADKTADATATMDDRPVLAEFVNPEDSLSHLRYLADGQTSLNDRCAVRKVRLNPKMPPLYVNGRPVGFC